MKIVFQNWANSIAQDSYVTKHLYVSNLYILRKCKEFLCTFYIIFLQFDSAHGYLLAGLVVKTDKKIMFSCISHAKKLILRLRAVEIKCLI